MGRWWYRWASRILPRTLRDAAGHDMARAFDAAQTHARDTRGLPGLLLLWIREAGGLLHAAHRARWPDEWSRRTAPAASSPSSSSDRPTMDTFFSDLKFAARTFVRRPAILILAAGTLSLGIGASTAMFSVIESVLLRPLDYPEPEQIQAVYPAWPELEGHPTLGFMALRGTWSWPEFWLVAEQQGVFEHFAGYAHGNGTLTVEGGRPERVPVSQATWELFPLLGTTTRLGRVFDDDDGRDGNVVLLSYDTWTDRYGSDPDILGRTVYFAETAYTVVGVLSEGFRLGGQAPAYWVPQVGSSTDDGLSNHGSTRALGRLADGVGQEQAEAEVQRLLQTLPADHGAHGATVRAYQDELTRDVRPVLMIMLAAAALLLVVACGNVAALLLGAGIDRERELAVRGAVGATQGRLTQQLLTESSVLAMAGAAGGVLVAVLTTRALAFLAPPDIPRLGDVAVNGTVLAFAVGLATACGILFGLIPALTLSSTDLAGAIGSNRTTKTRRARLQSGVVVGELALATVLVVGGVLLARTVSALNQVDPGFDHEGLVNVSFSFPYTDFRQEEGGTDMAAAWSYREQMAEALAALPGVTAVHTVSNPPFFGWRGNNGVLPEGWADESNQPVAERRFVSPGYFAFMGIPILEGREFKADDEIAETEDVVVVSRGLAELAWPGESAVGKGLRYWGRDARVVGVADDIRDEDLQARTELAFYAPSREGGGVDSPFVLRVAGEATPVLAAVRDRIWSVDPDVPITRVATTAEMMSDQLAGQRYRARLMVVFAALAALFAVLGIYGVTSRSVARRTREMGLRVALGADRASVHRMVTREALRLAVGGVLAGVLIALAVGGVLERFLWGVSRSDPVTLVAVAVGLPLLAAFAALAPARRATRVDPVVALRSD